LSHFARTADNLRGGGCVSSNDGWREISWNQDAERFGVCWPRFDMCYTCNYVENVAKMIQIRHVPEDVHRKLKARAAEVGMSLSDFLRKEVELVAQRPTITQLLERIARRSSVRPRVSAAEVIRAERDRR